MRLQLRHRQHSITVELHADGDHYRATIGEDEIEVEAHYLDDSTLVLTVGGRQQRLRIARVGRDRLVAAGGESYTFIAESGGEGHGVAAALAPPEIIAPMPGKVLQVLVRPGERVAVGDGLVVLEAMKMENRMLAEAPATVSEVRVEEGQMVDGGQVLVVLLYDEESGKG